MGWRGEESSFVKTQGSRAMQFHREVVEHWANV